MSRTDRPRFAPAPGPLACAALVLMTAGLPVRAAPPVDAAAPPRLVAPAAADTAVAASAPADTAAAGGRRSVTQAPPAVSSDSGPSGDRREPRVQRRVVEDGGARIEELRVRGAVQRMTVTPKGGALTTPYEVQPTDAGRDFGEGPSTSRLGGQRTWRVLSF